MQICNLRFAHSFVAVNMFLRYVRYDVQVAHILGICLICFNFYFFFILAAFVDFVLVFSHESAHIYAARESAI